MKRKQAVSWSPLKIHALLFTIFVVIMGNTMLATFTYEGNASVPFENFNFFVIERITLMLLWGVVLLMHFGVHYIRSGWQTRHAANELEDQADEAEYYLAEDVRKAKLH